MDPSPCRLTDRTGRALRPAPGQRFARTDSGAPGAGNDVVTTITDKAVYVDVK
jgi:hypothetical protein